MRCRDALGYARQPIERLSDSSRCASCRRTSPRCRSSSLPAGSLLEERDRRPEAWRELEAALQRPAPPEDQIGGIVNALGGRPKIGGARRRAADELLVAPGPRPGEPRQIVRVILFGERGVEAIAAINDSGEFVVGAPPARMPSRKPRAGATTTMRTTTPRRRPAL